MEVIFDNTTKMNSETIKKNIKISMEFLGKDDRYLAQKLGRTVQNIRQKLEDGYSQKRGLSINDVFEFSRALGIPLAALFTKDLAALPLAKRQRFFMRLLDFYGRPSDEQEQIIRFGIAFYNYYMEDKLHSRYPDLSRIK